MTRACQMRFAWLSVVSKNLHNKAELGDGTGHYDMTRENDRADDDPEDGVPVDERCDVRVLPGVADVLPVASIPPPLPAPPPSLRA